VCVLQLNDSEIKFFLCIEISYVNVRFQFGVKIYKENCDCDDEIALALLVGSQR